MISDRGGLAAPAERDASTIAYLGHATTIITLASTPVVTDPVLTGRVAFIRRVATRPEVATGDAELVLISHGHHDHLHRTSMRMLDPDIPVVVPAGLGRLLEGWGHRLVSELAVGATIAHHGLKVTAVHADHSGFRPPLGPRAEAVGYVLEGGGARVYFAGDTALYDEMADLADRRLDAALLPVWGWGPNLGPGHLDPEQAAQAAAIIAPRVAIPIHWGTLWPAAVMWRRSQLIDPPHQFAAAVRRDVPGTTAMVLAPGESCDLQKAA